MQIGLGIGIPFTKSQVWLAVQAVFTPAKLFESGANGLWLDPSDSTTMFQDSAGTTPVTAVEQPVGLILDKSKGLVLGPELVTNGDFSAGTTGWTLLGAATISNGVATINSASSADRLQQTGVIPSNKFVKLEFDVVIVSGTLQFLDLLGGNLAIFTTSGKKSVIVFSASATGIQFFRGGAGVNCTIDNISVKELPGNHAFQSTSANRPTLSARYNLLEKTEDLSNAYWTQTGLASSTVSGAFTTLTENTANSVHSVSKVPVLTLQANTTPIKIQAIFKAGTRRYFQFQADNATVAVGCVVDTQNWTATALTGSGVITASSITPIGGGEYSVSVTGYFNSGTAVCNLVIYGLSSATQNNVSYLGNGSTIIVGKASLVPANQSSLPYQRVNTATDYDSDATKFPWYLKFNGTSSSLQTASINFTATDKMFVSAGVRRNSGHEGLIVENSVAAWQYSGAFGMGSIVAGGFFTGLSGTTKGGFGTYAKTAPSTDVATAIFDISSVAQADECKLRINTIGVVQNFVPPAAGTGNFSNYPLYIGARGGTSMFFNGNLYQLVIAGKQASTEEITSTETYINTKTKAY